MAEATETDFDVQCAQNAAGQRMHSREMGGALLGGGLGMGYIGTVTKSIEAQNREKALQIAWDIYRGCGDHELVLEAARRFMDFLNCAKDAA